MPLFSAIYLFKIYQIIPNKLLSLINNFQSIKIKLLYERLRIIELNNY